MTDIFDVPCIEYKPIFKSDDLKEIELKVSYEDGTSKKVKCLRFSGKGGIEELLYIAEYYEKIASDLNILDEDKFEYFKSVLDHGPRAKWMSLDPATNFLQDADGFKDCLSEYFSQNTMPSMHPHIG